MPVDGPQVYKGRWRGVLVAVKVLHHSSKENYDDLMREAAILRRLRHPNVVNFLGLGTNDNDEVATPSKCFLME